MPSASYHRNKAETCRRLAADITDGEAAARLYAMALEHDAAADRQEAKEAGAPPYPLTRRQT